MLIFRNITNFEHFIAALMMVSTEKALAYNLKVILFHIPLTLIW